MKINKKIVSVLLIFAIAIVGASCGGNSEVEDNGVVNIYNWGEYIDEDLLAKFTEETGIKVVYDTFDSNESMYVILKNGGVNYDVLMPSDYMIEKMVKEDMLEKINYENVPNYSQIRPELKGMSYDPNNEYTVPYFWGTLGIVYNTKMVNEEVNSFDILWDKKYENQIFMYESQRDSMAVALKRLGYSINSTDENELVEAKNLLIEQKPLVQAYVTDPIRDKMIGEEGALAVMYSGDAMYCMQENENLAYAIPDEGSNTWFDCMVIPKGAENKENAEKFINFMTEANNALQNSNSMGFTTPNEEAFNMLDEETKSNVAYWATDDILARNEVFKDLGATTAVYDKLWTEMLLAN